MPDPAEKSHLKRYLDAAREAVVWKLDGLSPYDMRRPLVPTGTNLLGLVKHLSGVEAGYFGLTFGRPYPSELCWVADRDADPTADMWARADETRDQVVDLYRRMWAAADATIEDLDLESPGRVPWWRDGGDVTLRRILVHVIAETNRHAGHADILRELIDGAVGLRRENPNLPGEDAIVWPEHRERLEQVARLARG